MHLARNLLRFSTLMTFARGASCSQGCSRHLDYFQGCSSIGIILITILYNLSKLFDQGYTQDNFSKILGHDMFD